MVCGRPGYDSIASDGRQLTLEGTPILNASNGSSGLRSADGGRLYIEQSGRVAFASAADGKVLRSVVVMESGPNAFEILDPVSGAARTLPSLATGGLAAG